MSNHYVDYAGDSSEVSVLKQTFVDLAARSVQRGGLGSGAGVLTSGQHHVSSPLPSSPAPSSPLLSSPLPSSPLPSSAIDKTVFLFAFPLPGVLGERLFAAFDSDNDGYIDFEEYVRGLSVCCRGSKQQLNHFLFRIVDLSGDGRVNAPELRMLLTHLPKTLVKLVHDRVVARKYAAMLAAAGIDGTGGVDNGVGVEGVAANPDWESPSWHLRVVDEVVEAAMAAYAHTNTVNINDTNVDTDKYANNIDNQHGPPAWVRSEGKEAAGSDSKCEEQALDEEQFCAWMDGEFPELLEYVQLHFHFEPRTPEPYTNDINGNINSNTNNNNGMHHQHGISGDDDYEEGCAEDSSSDGGQTCSTCAPPNRPVAVLETLLPPSGSATGPRRHRILSVSATSGGASLPASLSLSLTGSGAQLSPFEAQGAKFGAKAGAYVSVVKQPEGSNVIRRVASIFKRKRADSSAATATAMADDATEVIRRSATTSLSRGSGRTAEEQGLAATYGNNADTKPTLDDLMVPDHKFHLSTTSYPVAGTPQPAARHIGDHVVPSYLHCAQCSHVVPLQLRAPTLVGFVDSPSDFELVSAGFMPLAHDADNGTWVCWFKSVAQDAFVASFRAAGDGPTPARSGTVLRSINDDRNGGSSTKAQSRNNADRVEAGAIPRAAGSRISLVSEMSSAPRDFSNDVEPQEKAVDDKHLAGCPSDVSVLYDSCPVCKHPWGMQDLRCGVDGAGTSRISSKLVPSPGTAQALIFQDSIHPSKPIAMVQLLPFSQSAQTSVELKLPDRKQVDAYKGLAVTASIFSVMDSGSHAPHAHPLYTKSGTPSRHVVPGAPFRPGVRAPVGRAKSSDSDLLDAIRGSSFGSHASAAQYSASPDGPAAVSAALAESEAISSSSMLGGAAVRAVGFLSRIGRNFRRKKHSPNAEPSDPTHAAVVTESSRLIRTSSGVADTAHSPDTAPIEQIQDSSLDEELAELEMAALHPNATVSGATWSHYAELIRSQLSGSEQPDVSRPQEAPAQTARPISTKSRPLHAHTVSGALGREMAGALASYSRPEALAAVDTLDLQRPVDARLSVAYQKPVPIARSSTLFAQKQNDKSATNDKKLNVMSFAAASRAEITSALTEPSPASDSVTANAQTAPDVHGAHTDVVQAPQMPPFVPPPISIKPVLHHALMREDLWVTSGRSGSASHLQSSPVAGIDRNFETPHRTGRVAAAMAALGYRSPAQGPLGPSFGSKLGYQQTAEEAEEAQLVESEKQARLATLAAAQEKLESAMDTSISKKPSVTGSPVLSGRSHAGSSFTGFALKTYSSTGSAQVDTPADALLYTPKTTDAANLGFAFDDGVSADGQTLAAWPNVLVLSGKSKFMDPARPYSFQYDVADEQPAGPRARRASSSGMSLGSSHLLPLTSPWTPSLRTPIRSAVVPALALNSANPPALSLGAGAARSLVMHGATMIEHEGWLYKSGPDPKSMRKRWYYLQQNFLYWYSNHLEGEPRGVLFLDGSYVKPIADVLTDDGKFYGLCIHTSSAHGDRVKVLYAKSAHKRDEWLGVLRRACRSVPFEEEYDLREEVGKGRFARVFRATKRSTGVNFAVKIINKLALSDAERELLRTEIAILKLVQHPHIIRLENIFETSSQLYIVMELLEGGELFNNLVGRSRFSEVEARQLIKPLLESVAYLHSLGIVHRDIKPENILCTGSRGGVEGGSPGFGFGVVKIADFGLSKLVHPGEVLTMPCGTLQYAAPEVLAMKGYGPEADLWSLGVILYLVVRGRLPFDAPDKQTVIHSTIEANVDFSHSVWASWSPSGLDFVKGLLAKDPSKRLSARSAMQHEWLRSA